MLWAPDHLAAIDDALGAARGGQPSILTVTGEAGAGKSTLLKEAVRRASGFSTVQGYGDETGYREPLVLLQDLGVVGLTSPHGVRKEPLAAAQNLRERVDELSVRGPVLIVVDDLQWVDAESAEALYRLFRRASGDRLLIMTATRPHGGARHELWQRLVDRGDNVYAVSLMGLSLEQATALVRTYDSAATLDTVRRLRQHTDGNALYLRSLLSQHSVSELDAMAALPAPVELAQRVQAQLGHTDPDAASLLHASAVVGHVWTGLPVLARIAEVGDPATAAQAIVDAGLFETQSNGGAAVRTVHALVRTAVYESIPLPRRRELHLRAAAELSNPMSVLEHRVSATDRFDDELADELESAAGVAHLGGEYRQAGYLFRWSSGVTSDPVERDRRWLDALYESVWARDLALVRPELTRVSGAPDIARAALVQGAFLVTETKWRDATAVFARVDAASLDAADALTRHRLLVLDSWARLGAGREVKEVVPVFQRVLDEDVQDPALYGYIVFLKGQVYRALLQHEKVRAGYEGMADEASEVSPEHTFLLGFSGAVSVFSGRSRRAQIELEETVARLRAGVTDIFEGVFQGLLALARWQLGDWSMAELEIRVALESSTGTIHPMVLAIEPLFLVGRGDLASADAKLAEIAERLRVSPWYEAVGLLMISQVARLHADATPAERRDYLAGVRRTFGDRFVDPDQSAGDLWLLHLALAAVWAGDSELVSVFVEEGLDEVGLPQWTHWGVEWVAGLAAESVGDLDAASAAFDRAIALPDDELPLYRAHLFADAARVRATRGDAVGSASARTTALDAYRRLGAAGYVAKLEAEHPSPITAEPRSETAADPAAAHALASLSDRERDVVTLLVSGLSYAQIARDLYVTRSTVGFHLSKIYAKAGVSSRHALTDLLRGAL